MKTKIYVILLLVLSCSFVMPLKAQKITIVYDNYLHKEKYKADWGFSCIIDYGNQSILFDTGTRKDIFLHNLSQLKENLNRIDMIVISHNHGDHTGNLLTVLETKNDVPVYMPYSTPSEDIKKIKDTGAKVITDKKPRDLGNNFYLSGELGTTIKEQALFMDTPKGVVVITGCAHPGITEIVSKAKEVMKKDIYLVLGGFHLGNHSTLQIQNIIREFKDMGVQNVAATHCTGDKAIELFKEAYGENYIKAGAGKEIEID
jgi:7,8-dihydropterin-6-yl-methyl-4-(beta-D-ribofuranosyl)aminobenzene 5'-phosphate synthase